MNPARLRSPSGPAAVLSVLVGAAVTMPLAGLAAQFETLFSRYESATAPAMRLLIGAALLALAGGVRVPQRIAFWASWLVWRRFLGSGSEADVSRVLLGASPIDRTMYWLVLSFVALTAGAAVALWPIHVRFAWSFYAWMHVHFVWSVGPLGVLQAFVVLLALLPPFVLLGLALVCVHHLSGPFGRWTPTASGWLLWGGAGGVSISAWMIRVGLRSEVTVMAAALPVLFVSILAAVSGSRRWEGFRETERSTPGPPPISSDRRPGLIRVSIVSLSGCIAGLGSLWVGDFARVTGGAEAWAAAMLLAGGIGVLAARHRHRRGAPSVGGFAASCAAAGLILAAGPVASAYRSTIGVGGMALTAGLGFAAAAFALTRGRETLLSQVAGHTAAGTETLSRMLVSAAVIVLVGAPAAERWVGDRGALMAVSLLVFLLGGALVVRQ